MVLNFTKNQTLILGIFFNNPDKSFYLRELGRFLGKAPGVFQKDINRLVEGGYLLSEFRANSRFFHLNRKHPLYDEIRSIFLKTVGAAGVLRRKLATAGIKCAFIFGSFARGGEDKYSDIDLLVIGEPDENALISAVGKAQDELGREINVSIFSVTDLKRGLAQKEVFLEEIMDNPKIFIIGEQNDLEKISGQRRPAAQKNKSERS